MEIVIKKLFKNLYILRESFGRILSLLFIKLAMTEILLKAQVR